MGCSSSRSGKVISARPVLKSSSSFSLDSMLPSSFGGDISRRYSLGAILGYGQYGTVRLALSVYHSDEQFAVKTINLKRLGSSVDNVRREIAILFRLDHPNIIRLYEVYEEPKYFHLVTEYCSGGELFDRLIAKGHYPEAEAAGLFLKVLRAVNYLHSKGVCHRDIKPENFMFESGELKLIDFGLAQKFETNNVQEMHSQVGTPYYVAPEVMKGGYNYKCDIWSVGIMLYMMITGCMLDNGKSSQQMLNEVSVMTLDLNSPSLRNVSKLVKDLLMKLLTPDPADRPTAQEAMNHPWFQQASLKEVQLDPMVLFSLKRFKAGTRLKSAALTILAKHLTSKKTKDLKNIFTAIDSSSDGSISFHELHQALANAGFTSSMTDISEIMDNVDREGSGVIKYSDFIAATLAAKWIMSKEMMKNAFNYFDLQGEGFITKEGFKEIMTRSGRALSDEEVAGIIAEADVFHEGKISFAAFQQVLKRG